LIKLLLIPTLLAPSFAESPFVAIPGIFTEEVPADSIFYETVLPLLFEFEIPYWNKTDLALPIGGANCSSPEWNESSICPTKYYLPEVQRRFTDYLFDAQPILNSFESVNASAQISEIQFECDTLAKHFKDIFIDDRVFNNYLNHLKSCQYPNSFDDDLQFYRKIPQYNYNVSDVFFKMRQGYFNEVWMKVHDGRVDAGLWSNALNILSSFQFFNYYMEATRWKLAMSDCQSGRIPSTLIPTGLLMDSLQGLSEVLTKMHHTLVISPDDLGNYYNAPIADCTYTSASLIVRLLIPVTQPHQSHSLVRIATGNFWIEDSQSLCKIDIDERYPHYLVDNLANVVYTTNCKPNEMCHVPSAKSVAKIDPCLSAHLNSHFWNIIKYCKLTCKPTSPYYVVELISSNIITQEVSSDNFMVTKVSKDNKQEIGNRNDVRVQDNFKQNAHFNITCFKHNGIVSTEHVLPNSDIGAVLVRMPCRCRLHYNNSIIDKLEENTYPCKDNLEDESVEQKHVVPLHWVKPEKLSELKKLIKGSPLSLKVGRDDLLIIPGNSFDSSSSEKLTTNEDTGTSGGVKFLLTLYFILLICGIIMLSTIIYKLKNLGISVNPLLLVKQSPEISYRNLQPKSNGNHGGILVNEDDTY